jgi:Fe-S-cluster containining protein
LDKVKSRIRLTEQHWGIIKKIRREVDKRGMLSEFSYNEQFEIIYYAVMTNEETDVVFVANNPQLCERCGWCCKYCNPIEVTEEDIKKSGGYSNLEPIRTSDGNKTPIFNLKTPCSYLQEDNKCSIYPRKPKSCGTYPLGVFMGEPCVQRNIHCEYVMSLLLNKVKGFADTIVEKKKKV